MIFLEGKLEGIKQKRGLGLLSLLSSDDGSEFNKSTTFLC